MDSPIVLAARFETLPRRLAHGWMMRITASTRNIQHVAAPFVARIGDQEVEFLCVNSNGDLFEGYLRRTPHVGDRLFIGYAEADQPTPVVFEGTVGPTATS